MHFGSYSMIDTILIWFDNVAKYCNVYCNNFEVSLWHVECKSVNQSKEICCNRIVLTVYTYGLKHQNRYCAKGTRNSS